MKDSKSTLEAHTSGQSNQPLSQPAHALSWAAVAEEIQADTEDGLTSEVAKRRLEEYGRNELGDGGGVNIGKILMKQVANAMTLVLLRE